MGLLYCERGVIFVPNYLIFIKTLHNDQTKFTVAISCMELASLYNLHTVKIGCKRTIQPEEDSVQERESGFYCFSVDRLGFK